MRDRLRVGLAFLLLLCMAALPVSANEVTLNFKKADIRAFIEFVSGFSGKNFLVDNRVQGNVTIISPTPISEDEAYDVFLSVLEVNGFAAVPSGSVVKIVPRAESKQKSIPVRDSVKSRADDAMVTQVFRLNYADAQQLVALIRPLISPNSHLVAYPRGNMLLLTDSASNIQRIQKILKLVDRKDAIGVQMFPLEFASAEKLAATISGLYTGKGGVVAIKAIAHQPGNILVVVAAPQLLNEVASMVKKLDIQPRPNSGRLQVRYLKHANAEDVAKVLSELVGGNSAAKPGHAKVLFSGNVKIVADPTTNALLITADPTDITAINQIIDKLDIRRLQVLIEALIVEVAGNGGEQFGVEWAVNKPVNGGKSTLVGGQKFKLIESLTSIDPGGGVGAAASALPSGLTLGVLQGSLLGGTLTLGALVHALETTGEANVLSTPTILTMDNEEAEIIVGQNVPFITGQNSTQGGISNPFQTIERKDIGLTLRVKPQISAGETIRLEIYQEVSSISSDATLSGTASDLITNKRSVKTVALAKDGQMLVLGGLIREDSVETVQKVPCIGAVPIVGEAFKFSENSRRKVNLMIFLRPRIIRTDSDIENITNEKYSSIKSKYEKIFTEGSIIFPQRIKKIPDDMSLESLKLDRAAPSTDVPGMKDKE